MEFPWVWLIALRECPWSGSYHCTIIERVFKYLRGIINYCLTYTGYPNAIKMYSDANWVTDSNNVKSTTRYIYLYSVVHLCLKILQTNSDCQEHDEGWVHCSRYYLLIDEWLNDLLSKFSIVPSPILLISTHIDAKSTVEILKQVMV